MTARQESIAQALRDRGFIAAAERCASALEWEAYYAEFLGSRYDDLSEEEKRSIFPWNFEEVTT